MSQEALWRRLGKWDCSAQPSGASTDCDLGLLHLHLPHCSIRSCSNEAAIGVTGRRFLGSERVGSTAFEFEFA